ncbi:DUF1624 domain-containing protein [Pseudonocardiaceae bacterium YIM PH 21723]|nr:DUF1624 domain-containing protein [Pseudonocardiaceae bacterium YIM PH 21723]
MNQERVTGIDTARGLAVLGMFAVHAGPQSLAEVTEGRASALFLVLAGVSLALLSRGDLRRARARIAVRAGLLLAIGLGLRAADVPFVEILTGYGVCFLLCLPLVGLSRRMLLGIAIASVLIGPQLRFLLLEAQLFSWDFPALTYLPLVLIGLAVGRLDLVRARVRLLVTGLVLAVLGYGLSWLILEPLGLARRLRAQLPYADPELWPTGGDLNDYDVVALPLLNSHDLGVPLDPAWLLVTGAYTRTTFDLIFTAGVALAVIGGCLFVTEHVLGALGSMALTWYVAHMLVLDLLWTDDGGPRSWQLFSIFAAVALSGAWVWRRYLGRGPLERVLHSVSIRVAGLVPAREAPATVG